MQVPALPSSPRTAARYSNLHTLRPSPGSRPHPSQAAPFDREQGFACSLHPGGPPRDARPSHRVHHRLHPTSADIMDLLPRRIVPVACEPAPNLASGRRGQRSGSRSLSQRNPCLSAALPNLAIFDQGGALRAPLARRAAGSGLGAPPAARRATPRRHAGQTGSHVTHAEYSG